MTREHRTFLHCDRCRSSAEVRTADVEYNWGEMWAKQFNGPLKIGSGNHYSQVKHICPACMNSLMVWWKGDKQPDQEKPS